MACWTLFLQKFQSLSVAAYIDDAYLRCEQSCIDEVQEAVDITHQWDSLTGQAANEGKCFAWANGTKGRQIMKSTFRNMKHSHSVEVLGANIQTTEKLAFGWDPKKDQNKVLRDIQLIKALPRSRTIHCRLVESKVVPQINFSPHLSLIPKDDLRQITELDC